MVSDDLVNKAKALTNATLRTKDEKIQKNFKNYSTQLLHSTVKLREQLKSSNYETVKYGVEDVHRIYEKIESLFVMN